MASARSIIRVAIIGDAKGLSKALKEGEADLGGFAGKAKKIGGIIAGSLAVAEIADFVNDALVEADRLGDATERLRIQLGDLSDPLVDAAGNFHDLGQSKQDILELAASFADTATALGVADPLIADFADDAAATAAAVALMGDQDAATVIDLIGKAAGGSDKALKALGVNLTEDAIAQQAMKDTGKDLPEQLTDTEKAAAAYKLILEQLKPKLDAATDGNADLEQKQKDVQAQFETLTGEIGTALEGPLSDLLTWILSGIDGLKKMDTFLDHVADSMRDAVGPIADVADALFDAAAGLSAFLRLGGPVKLKGTYQGGGGSSGGPGMSGVSFNVNVDAFSSKDAEQAIMDALRNATARSGELQ